MNVWKFLWCLCVAGLLAQIASSQTFNWSTIAGLPGTPAYADGTNGTAYFNHPTGTAVDANGNVYVADANNYVIRELSNVGGSWVSTTIAGLAGSPGIVDGTNSSARFSSLGQLETDSLGNIYIFDNIWIRKLSAAGTNWVVNTVYSPASGGWAVGANGNYYTASNFAIIQLAPLTNGAASSTNYSETILAGFPGIAGFTDGTNSVARFNSPWVFAVDAAGTIYLSDNGEVRTVGAIGGNWVVSTIAASSYNDTSLGPLGNLFAAYNNEIVELPVGSSNWVAIGGTYYQSGSADGTNSSASFYGPRGFSVDLGGHVFVADYGNNTIRMGTIVPTGSLQVSITPPGAIAAGAQWQVDGGTWLTNNAIITNILVGNHTISFSTNLGWTTPANEVVSISSNQLTAVTGIYTQQFGSLQVTIGPQSATSAGGQWQVNGGPWQGSGAVLTNVPVGFQTVSFSAIPGWLAPSNMPVLVNEGQTTATNAAYIVSYGWNAIAGLPNTPSYADGTNNNAFFSSPEGATTDGAGNVYVVDAGNLVIRKISPVGPNWVTTTIAGLAGTSGLVDGTNSAARFNSLSGIQIDASGNLYVLDYSPYVGWCIRKVAPVGTNWVTTTIHPLPVNSSGWAVDAFGNFYSASNYTVIQLSPVFTNGVATTNFATTILAGFPGLSGSADGTNYVARFSSPSVFGVDSSGIVYLTDNGKLRTISPQNGVWVTATVNQSTYSSMYLDKSGNLFGCNSTITGYYPYTSYYNLEILWPGGTNWSYFDTLSNATSLGAVAVGSDGTVFVTDLGASVIRAGTSASILKGSVQVLLQPNSLTNLGAGWRVDAGLWQSSGAAITNLVVGNNHALSFAPVYGWQAPSNQWLSVSNNATTTLTANYVQQFGALQVTISPLSAANAGAQWQVDGGAWQNNGSTVSNLSVGQHTVSFTNLAGYITPPTQSNVTIVPNQTTDLSGTYLALGAVEVTIAPSDAVAAGAQWQIDGGSWLASGAVTSNLSLGSHTISFQPVAGWITPSNVNLTVNSGQTNILSANYVVLGSLQVTLTPPGAASAGAQWSIDSGAWQTSGNVVSNLANGDHIISFSPLAGFITPSNQVVDISPGGTTNVAASYIALGGVTVFLSPTNAVLAGAQWALDGGAWQGSGITISNVSLGNHILSFSPTTGFITPSNINVAVISGQTTNVSAMYVALGGVLATINPASALTNGARWEVDGGSWQTSGTVASNLSLGVHTVSFSSLPSFTTPSNQVVTVTSGQTTNVSATYVALGSLQVAIAPAGAVVAGAFWRVDGGTWLSSGSVVSNLAAGNHTVSFSSLAGWNSPADQIVAVGLDQITVASGVYVEQFGDLQVILLPDGVVSAGAQWHVDGGPWQSSGTTLSNIPVGNHLVSFASPVGWAAPSAQNIIVNSNQTTRITAVYQGVGAIQVTLQPVGAIVAGAQWQVDGGAWVGSGSTVSNLSRGTHLVAYKSATDWVAPGSELVSVLANQTTITNGIYTDLGYSFTTIAGTPGLSGANDGGATMDLFSTPSAVCVDANTNIYIADTGNSVIRRLSPTNGGWISSTVAGLAGLPGSSDGTNSQARFDYPAGITVDAGGNLFVADQVNSTIRRITTDGTNWTVSTIAGFAGSYGSANGTNSAARFYYPAGLAVDDAGEVYVADEMNSTIRKLTPVNSNDWSVTTIAGAAGVNGSTDGTNDSAHFYWPGSLAVGTAGNIFVADTFNDTVRRLSPVGTNYLTTTICGQAGVNNSIDGTNNGAIFDGLGGIAIDSVGNLFVADTYSSVIRKIVPVGTNWVTSTIGGLAYVPGSADGTNSIARFNLPCGICLASNGLVIIADTDNQTIRAGVALTSLPPPPVITLSSDFRLNFKFQAIPGFNYQVQYATNFSPPIWINFGVTIAATNSSITFTDTAVSGSERFYRVLVTP